MSLTLSILAGPDGTLLEKRVFTGGSLSLGRAPGNDWVLADPQRHLSKRHCTIACRDSFWEVTDLSTNGTFLNGDRAPIGNGEVRDLQDGDRLRLGSYQIGVAIAAPEPVMREALYDLPEVESFEGPPQPDHSPGIEDAFVPPLSSVLLDEDWDLGDVAAPLSAPVVPPQSVLSPQPVLSPQSGFSSQPVITPQPVMTPQPAVSFPPAVSSGPATSRDVAEPAELMAAFLRGAGLDHVQPADPVAAMEELGAAFRAFVGGLRETLVARAAVKSEFRIEQTMIRARGNNPLKFAASDDDALLALVGAGRRSDVGPAAAVAEAFRDIRLHELATMAAMQSAVRGLLRELAPEKMRDGAGQSLLSSQRKARAWDAFEAAHGRLTQALADNFDSAFGRAFARAYEQAVRETRQ